MVRVTVKGHTVDGITYDSDHVVCPVCGGHDSATVIDKPNEEIVGEMEVTDLKMLNTCFSCNHKQEYTLRLGRICKY